MASYDPGYGPLLGTRVRLATGNLWGRWGPWAERSPAIVETLRAIDADILGLQEVWEDDERSQTREIAAALGYDGALFHANLEREGARSGNAILARWPFARHAVRLLPRAAGNVADDEGEERLLLFAEIDGPRGPIQVFCAHLSWRDDHSAVRQAQVAAICEEVRSRRPRTFPAVLCGDLNADADSDEIRMLTGKTAVPVPGVMFRDSWLAAGNHSDPGWTSAVVNPFVGGTLDRDRRIDYVMVAAPKRAGAGHVLGARVAGNAPIDGIWPSDHFAVVTELRY